MSQPSPAHRSDLAHELPAPLRGPDRASRGAVTAWLVEHGIVPDTLAPGRPVERDASLNRIAWVEVLEDGSLRRRWRYVPRSDLSWPSPFPVLDVAAEPVATSPSRVTGATREPVTVCG